jgi:hypothetical protein
MLKKGAKATARRCLQDSHSGVAQGLRERSLGSGQTPIEMRFDRRMSRGQRAALFRLSSAHGATHGQYPFQGEGFGFHPSIIQHRQLRRWSVLLFLDPSRTKTEQVRRPKLPRAYRSPTQNWIVPLRMFRQTPGDSGALLSSASNGVRVECRKRALSACPPARPRNAGR